LKSTWNSSTGYPVFYFMHAVTLQV